MTTSYYSIPVALLAMGCIHPAMAGDVTKSSDELRNEMAFGYQFGETYHVALEVFGQKDTNKSKLESSFYNMDEFLPADEAQIWANDAARADFDWTTGVRLRPGYNVTKNTRLFLDGGVVWGDFSMELTDATAAQFGADNLEASDTLRGIRYGGGVSHQIQNLSALSLVLDYSMTEFEPSEELSNTGDFNRIESTDPLYAPAYQQIMLSLKAEFDPGFGF
jgi:opacity protein-like surface antigen